MVAYKKFLAWAAPKGDSVPNAAASSSNKHGGVNGLEGETIQRGFKVGRMYNDNVLVAVVMMINKYKRHHIIISPNRIFA